MKKNKIDEKYIKLFEPLPQEEFLEIRENYHKSVWISSINELKEYEIDENKDIFIQQHSKGDNKNRKGENSKSIKHIFFDIDYIKDLCLLGESSGAPDLEYYKLELVLRDITLAGLPEPSLVLFSGGGFHIYFELKERTYKDITPILKEIAIKINADTKATDKARIMRLAGSINHKKEYNKPKAEIIFERNITYDLELFEKIANKKAKKNNNLDNSYEKEHNNIDKTNQKNTKSSVKKYRNSKLTPDINTNMHCVNEMLKGAGEGHRNTALGRITKKLQQMGFQKHKAKIIIMSWNTDNKPPEKKDKLLRDFEMYWERNYNLLGCRYNNFELKEQLQEFCNKDRCDLRKKTINFEIKRDDFINYSNKLLKQNKYHKISGNALIVLGLLKHHNGKLSREKLKEKLRSNVNNKQSISDRLLSEKLQELEKLKLVKIKKQYKKKGIREPDLIIVIEKKKFNLGYTLINHHVIRRFIDKTMTQAEFKVYLLLRSYIYAGKNYGFPNQVEMAYKLRVSQQTVSEHLNNLEKKDFIKIEYKYTKKGYLKCIYKI